MSPAGPTTLSFTRGDGSSEARTIPQGPGASTLDFSHVFAAGASRAYVQRATIDETGRYAESVTYGLADAAHDPVFSVELAPPLLVGEFTVWGNYDNYVESVTSTGDRWPQCCHRQVISPTYARASGGFGGDRRRGAVKIRTAPRADTGSKLPAGSYPVIYDPWGFKPHDAWRHAFSDPWRIGTVTIGEGGLITSASAPSLPGDATPPAIAVVDGVAGPFPLPDPAYTWSPPGEAAIFIHDNQSLRGNDAPLTVVDGLYIDPP